MRCTRARSDAPAGRGPGPDGDFDPNIPQPGSELRAWAVAVGLGALGLGVLVLALSGVVGGVSRTNAPVTPPVLAATPTPVPTQARGAITPAGRVAGAAGASSGAQPGSVAANASARAIVNDPSTLQAHHDFATYQAQTSTHIAARWMQSFYPIYATAQRTFGVNWLLIASIHKQETAFSTAPSTYKGLNFAGCCGGPMQFNVKNGGPPGGSVSTWALVSDSYRYGKRPAAYSHRTLKHPSIYDDFDSIMAGAHLLSADGASYALDDSAWNAAYDYYGHDPTGVTYADQVLARAIGWSQHGFCINCGIETSLVEAVHAAYGAPVAASFEAATVARKTRPRRLVRSAHLPHGR